MLIIGWCLYFGLGLGNKLMTKKISWAVKEKRNNHLFFLLINSLTACVVFFISNQFQIQYTFKTLICALIYGAVVLMNFPVSFATYRYADITTATVLSSAGGLVTNSLVGALIFKEQITVLDIIRILLMVGAVYLIFVNERKFIQRQAKKPAIKPLLWLTLATIVIGCVSTLVQKYHANAPDVSDSNSYFFFTNLVMTIVILPLFIWRMIRFSGGTRCFLKALPFQYLPFFMGHTLLCNFMSMVSIFLIARMPVLVYTPMSAAIGILGGVGASLIRRERLTVYSVSGAILSMIAVMI